LKSTRTIIAWLCLLISFMTLFLSVGYASVADTLIIDATASYTIPDPTGVVIENIAVVGGAAQTTKSSFMPSTTNAMISLSGTSGQFATYEITFKNYSTTVKYAFNAVISPSSVEDNAYLNNGLTVSTKLTDGTDAKYAAIAPGAELKIRATYTIGNGLPQSISTLFNYEFIVHVDSAGDYAAEKSLERFAEILNSDTTYTAEEASALLDQNITEPMTKMEILQEIMSTQGGSGTGYYVGNVVGSGNLHSTVLGELFEDDLALNLYDPATGQMKETEMTCLIKEQEICGGGTKEMILYMTAETISGKCDRLGSGGWVQSTPIDVYAVVFTYVGTEWVQLGDIYEGQANPNNYDAPLLTYKPDANSFRTDSWVSTAKSYDVITALPGPNGNLVNAYSYNIAANQELSDIMSTKDTTANSVFKGLLDVSQDVLDGEYGNITGTAVTALEVQLAEIQTHLGTYVTKNADGSYTVSANATRAEIEPYMVHLRALLTPFEDRLIAGK